MHDGIHVTINKHQAESSQQAFCRFQIELTWHVHVKADHDWPEPAMMWTWLLRFLSFKIYLNQYFSESSWNRQCLNLWMLGWSRCLWFNLKKVFDGLFAKALWNFSADRVPKRHQQSGLMIDWRGLCSFHLQVKRVINTPHHTRTIQPFQVYFCK